MEPAHEFTGRETRQQLEQLTASDNRATRRRAATRLQGPVPEDKTAKGGRKS